MSISPNAVAYSTVIVAAMALIAIGTPSERAAGIVARPYATPAYSAALNAQLAAYAAAVGPHAAPATAEAAGVKLRSVGFDFPISDRTFPPGPGAELVSNSCQSCHSPGMILTQPPLTKAEWTGEVTKMLRTYKAPFDEKDVPAIVAYLASLKIGP
jgi:mono/diheme cytochrome c family protein